MTELTVERLARLMRDEAYPEFVHAPPPEWALRAAEKILAALGPVALPDGAVAAERRAIANAVARLTRLDTEAPDFSWVPLGEVLLAVLDPDKRAILAGETPLRMHTDAIREQASREASAAVVVLREALDEALNDAHAHGILPHHADNRLTTEWAIGAIADCDDASCVDGLAILADTAEAARAHDERVRAEQRFLPLGDNHHNALMCPYCTDGHKFVDLADPATRERLAHQQHDPLGYEGTPVGTRHLGPSGTGPSYACQCETRADAILAALREERQS